MSETTSSNLPQIDPLPPCLEGRVGYIALVGRPNVGKSTFLNAVLDFRLAAVSSKPQTTRRRWLGVRTDADSQLIFLDCPGVHEVGTALDELMQEAVTRAVQDADLVLGMADPTRPPAGEDRLVAEVIASSGKPACLALNKTDAASPEQVEAAAAFFAEHLPGIPQFRICALQPASLTPLIQVVKERLPVGPFFYPPDQSTDAMEREVGAELIRETVLQLLRDEVPHATAVVIEEWREHGERRRISAVLHVERESQKGILIGKSGRMLARIRTQSEQKLAELTGGPVRLRLWVKVAPNWRRDRRRVREFEKFANRPGN
ncbi:MAG: GTPase Era [Kiritimatiellaeota bacterium]|nr:GTPase Era [Kiritimatiellota bacterium]